MLCIYYIIYIIHKYLYLYLFTIRHLSTIYQRDTRVYTCTRPYTIQNESLISQFCSHSLLLHSYTSLLLLSQKTYYNRRENEGHTFHRPLDLCETVRGEGDRIRWLRKTLRYFCSRKKLRWFRSPSVFHKEEKRVWGVLHRINLESIIKWNIKSKSKEPFVSGFIPVHKDEESFILTPYPFFSSLFSIIFPHKNSWRTSCVHRVRVGLDRFLVSFIECYHNVSHLLFVIKIKSKTDRT